MTEADLTPTDPEFHESTRWPTYLREEMSK